MRKTMNFPMILLTCWLLAGPAVASRTVKQTREVAADATVSVELIAGSVRFLGWDRNEVQVTGTIGEDVDEVDVDGSSRHVRIEVELVQGKNRMRDAEAELEVRLPRGCRIEAETISAELSIEGVEGSVSAESVSGDVRIVGPVRDAEVETVSGRAFVKSDRPLRSGSFETVSGRVEFAAPLGGGRFEFSAVSGDLELRVPRSTSARFSVETFSGSIDSDFGPPPEKTSPYLPSKSLEFTLGSGDARVTLQSFSGNVRIRED